MTAGRHSALGVRVAEAVEAVRARWSGIPEAGIILGSGLGALGEAVEEAVVVRYREIPHFPIPGAAGHEGALVLGRLEGREVAIMRGRCHLYEGYSAQDVTFPVRVLARLGARVLIVTNAAGGLNPAFQAGDLMLISDHINFTGTNPLVGPNDEALGPRFPDVSAAYESAFRAAAGQAASAESVPVRTGVYAGVLGPSYETPAEIAMLRGWGADAVGMSTVAEVIVARHAGLRVLGISAITNAAAGSKAAPVSHEEVLRVANALEPRFVRLMRRIVRDLPG